jgi:hypothetical protein
MNLVIVRTYVMCTYRCMLVRIWLFFVALHRLPLDEFVLTVHSDTPSDAAAWPAFRVRIRATARYVCVVARAVHALVDVHGGGEGCARRRHIDAAAGPPAAMQSCKHAVAG